MKKTLICILLGMALLLSACGMQKTSEPEVAADENTAAAVEESAPAAEEESAPAAEEESTPAEEVEETEIQFGVIDGATYTSETLGYSCTLEGWTYATREEIAAMNNTTLEAVGDDLREQLEKANTFMDMFARSSDNLLNVNINFENLSGLYGAILSEEQYVNISYPQMQGALEQIGMSNVQVEKATVAVGGVEHPGLTVRGESNGVAVFQRMACIKCSGYMGVITVTSIMENHTEDVFDLFSQLQ